MSRSYHGQITKRSCFWNTHTWVTVSGHSCHCHYVDRNIICHHFVKFLYGGHAVIQNLRQVLTHHSGLVSFEVVKQWAYSGFCNKEILFRWHIHYSRNLIITRTHLNLLSHVWSLNLYIGLMWYLKQWMNTWPIIFWLQLSPLCFSRALKFWYIRSAQSEYIAHGQENNWPPPPPPPLGKPA